MKAECQADLDEAVPLLNEALGNRSAPLLKFDFIRYEVKIPMFFHVVYFVRCRRGTEYTETI